jgi:hypothetical protein
MDNAKNGKVVSEWSSKEGVKVPHLVPHQIFNKSNHEVEFLVISQPTSKGDRVLEAYIKE